MQISSTFCQEAVTLVEEFRDHFESTQDVPWHLAMRALLGTPEPLVTPSPWLKTPAEFNDFSQH